MESPSLGKGGPPPEVLRVAREVKKAIRGDMMFLFDGHRPHRNR